MADNYEQPVENNADENADEIPAQPTALNIRFVDANQQNELHFKLKSTTKLKKAMDAFSARTERNRATLRFLFDGERIQDDHTPEHVSLYEEISSIRVKPNMLTGLF